MVCAHAAIRMKVFPAAAVAGAPAGFPSKDFKSREVVDHRLTIQVAPDDCTGCGVCVDVCPAKSKTEVRHKAINMEPVADHRDVERPRWDFFTSIPPLDRTLIPHDTVKGLSLIHISEPTRLGMISYAVFCLKKKKQRRWINHPHSSG